MIVSGNNSNIINSGKNNNIFFNKNIVIDSTSISSVVPPFTCPNGTEPFIGPDGQFTCGGGNGIETFYGTIISSQFVEILPYPNENFFGSNNTVPFGGTIYYKFNFLSEMTGTLRVDITQGSRMIQPFFIEYRSNILSEEIDLEGSLININEPITMQFSQIGLNDGIVTGILDVTYTLISN